MYEPLTDVVTAPPGSPPLLTAPPGSPPPPLKPRDYLGWSIVNLICCCMPLGLLALSFSIKTRDANFQNDPASAAKHSDTACSLNATASVLGFILAIIFYIFYVLPSQK